MIRTQSILSVFEVGKVSIFGTFIKFLSILQSLSGQDTILFWRNIVCWFLEDLTFGEFFLSVFFSLVKGEWRIVFLTVADPNHFHADTDPYHWITPDLYPALYFSGLKDAKKSFFLFFYSTNSSTAVKIQILTVVGQCRICELLSADPDVAKWCGSRSATLVSRLFLRYPIVVKID